MRSQVTAADAFGARKHYPLRPTLKVAEHGVGEDMRP